MASKNISDKFLGAIRQRLSYKIMFYVSIALFVFVVLMSVYIYWTTESRRQADLQGFKQRGQALIQNLSSNAVLGVLTGDKVVLDEQLEMIFGDENISFAVIYNDRNEVITERYRGDRSARIFEFDTTPKIQEKQKIAINDIWSLKGESFMDFWTPVFLQTESSIPGEMPLFSPPSEEPQSLKGSVGAVRLGISLSGVNSAVRNARLFGGLIILMVIVTGFLIVILLERVVGRPVQLLAGASEQVGEGNFDVKVEVKTEDELGLLGRTFNKMTVNIKDQMYQTRQMNEDLKKQMQRSDELLASITQAVELLTETISELSSISTQQASGSAEQASSAYQASTTSQEIAASANSISETASRVTSVAQSTAETCEKGGTYLGNAVEGFRNIKEKVELTAKQMIELWEQSEKISGLVDIINEISEQTNLLALNAAIEAVGAGESGKRFSVVAAEVRRLAQRTLEATKVVSETIKEIQTATNSTVMVSEEGIKAVDEGVRAMDDLGDYFKNILDQVFTTSKAAEEISISTKQQTSACEQMVVSMTGVSDVAREVENGARNLASATSRLNSLAEQLKQMVAAGSVQGF